MLKITDLNNIKSKAISLLYIEPEIDEQFNFICHHPYFNLLYHMLNIDNKLKTYNIMDKNDFYFLCKHLKEMIESAKTLNQILFLINKPYLMVFFKYIKDDLSMKDYCDLLAHIWITVENPNQDVNCSIPEIIKWFKQADKTLLMQPCDYQYYLSLPDKLTVYRGVAVSRNPNGLSWTNDLEKAKWFANRFNTETKQGYILTKEISKTDVLAYFNTRDEKEIIIKVNNPEIYKGE